MKTVRKLRILRQEMCSQVSTNILNKLSVQNITKFVSKPTPHLITFLRFKF
jgi:hypothetical protein